MIADDYKQEYGIHTFSFVGHTLLFIRHAATMLELLNYSGPIQIQVELDNLRGVPWLHSPYGLNVLVARKELTLDNDVKFNVSSSSDELTQNPDGVLMDILKVAFFSVNWSGAVDNDGKLASLASWGYKFNGWPIPEKLKT